MADAGFFKGTSADQDRRFSDKELKLLKSMKFPPEFDKKVDMRKVNLNVIRPWIAKKVVELVGFEDEVVVEYAMGLLEDKSQPTPDPKKMQINLTGFLTKDTPAFMSALWNLLLEAQSDVTGVPRTFVEEKKEELRKARENDTRALDERDRRARLDDIRDQVIVVGVGEEVEAEVEAEDMTTTEVDEDATVDGATGDAECRGHPHHEGVHRPLLRVQALVHHHDDTVPHREDLHHLGDARRPAPFRLLLLLVGDLVLLRPPETGVLGIVAAEALLPVDAVSPRHLPPPGLQVGVVRGLRDAHMEGDDGAPARLEGEDEVGVPLVHHPRVAIGVEAEVDAVMARIDGVARMDVDVPGDSSKGELRIKGQADAEKKSRWEEEEKPGVSQTDLGKRENELKEKALRNKVVRSRKNTAE
ncbi:hypothetical protein V5O48_005585 [Marasmius crinis-equi]|uniref:PWI domain-containing protein n=1 Tax=Marasmius crinis-equi TaxID=585013 RepID=A0ABR3FLU5_9AGAR